MMSNQKVIQLSQIVKAVQAFEKQWKPIDFSRSTFFGEFDIWYYMAITDDRTCQPCIMLDQGLYKGWDIRKLFPYLEIVNDDQVLPHVHPNCRCTMLRLTDLRDYITATEPI